MSSLVYTKLFDEIYAQQPDANPADPAKWTPAVPIPGMGSLQVLDHFLQTNSSTFSCAATYRGVVMPADQFVDVYLANADNLTDLEIVLRSDADENNCYVFYVDSQGDGTADCAVVSYIDGLSTEILDFGIIPYSNTDVFRFSAIGSTLTVFQNGNELGQVSDTDHAAGFTGFFISAFFGDVPGGLKIARYAGGSVSQDVPATPPFLGTIVEDPTVSAAPFLGTVTVVGSVPPGAKNPFIGKVKVVAAPAGVPNPSLGQVVVVGSVPAGVTAVEIGKVVAS